MGLNEEILAMLAPLSIEGSLEIANDQANLIQNLRLR